MTTGEKSPREQIRKRKRAQRKAHRRGLFFSHLDATARAMEKIDEQRETEDTATARTDEQKEEKET